MTASRASADTFSRAAHFTTPQSRSARSSKADNDTDEFDTTFRNQFQVSGANTEPATDDTANSSKQSGRSDAAATPTKGATAYANSNPVVSELPDVAICLDATPQAKPASSKSFQSKTTDSSGSVMAKPDARKGPPQKETLTTADDPNPTDMAQLSIVGQQAVQAVSNNAPGMNEPEAQTEKSASCKVEETNTRVDPQESYTAAPITGDLAVAMKITQADSDPNGQSQADSGTGGAAQLVGNLHNSTQASAASATLPKHDPAISQTLTTTPVSQGQTSVEDSKSGKTEESSAAQPSDFEAEFNRARAEPVRGAHVQITSADNQRVDIRMQERSGTLSVSVRSGDASLTRTLQEHAPELSSRLSVEHFRAELWTPNSSRNSAEEGNTGSGSQNQNGGNSNPRDPNQRQNGKQNRNPEWIDEFESHPTAFQKRIEYTWPQ